MRARFLPTGIAVLLLLTWLTALPVAAQEPADDDQTVQSKVSPSGETKIFNDLLIPEGEVRSGAIRVIGGNLTVAGKVTGRITVLGGDVELLPTAQVEGTIVTIGGKIHRSDEALVTGDVLEVNRGKLSLTREEAEEIFGYDEDRDERLDQRDEDEEEWEAQEVEWVEVPAWRRHGWHRTVRPDFEVLEDASLRYNRAEGLALYIPFNPDTDDIPGFNVYGFVGRAFGAGEWYGRLGIGEYFWRGRIGLLVEGHKEPRHDDGWRITSKENSLGAFFIGRDWYDWYEAEGYGGLLVLALPDLVEFKVRYRDETHASMDSVTNWSMFGKDTFRGTFEIAPGKDINLSYQVKIGEPVGYFPRRISGNLSYAYTQTMGGSDFDYTRDDVTLEAFVPLHRRLGIRLNARTGAIYADTPADYGPQHLVPLGGIGSVQGYGYKSISPNNHYAVVNASFSMRKNKNLWSLCWHAGCTWDSPERIFTGDYFDKLLKEEEVYHAVGISFGGDDARFEFFRSLKDGDWVFYFRILDF